MQNSHKTSWASLTIADT